MECVIRYGNTDTQEVYNFYIRMNSDEEWTFLCSFPIVGSMIHYACIERIRELQHMGYKVFFGMNENL